MTRRRSGEATAALLRPGTRLEAAVRPHLLEADHRGQTTLLVYVPKQIPLEELRAFGRRLFASGRAISFEPLERHLLVIELEPRRRAPVPGQSDARYAAEMIAAFADELTAKARRGESLIAAHDITWPAAREVRGAAQASGLTVAEEASIWPGYVRLIVTARDDDAVVP